VVGGIHPSHNAFGGAVVVIVMMVFFYYGAHLIGLLTLR
jgi:hypothetical protein